MTTTTRPRKGRPALDLAEQVFGRWTVLARGPNVGIHVGWECRCDCGTERLVSGRDLRYGRSKSCGCLAREHYAGLVHNGHLAAPPSEG